MNFKNEQTRFRKKLQKAYETPSLRGAKQKLNAIRKELKLITNQQQRWVATALLEIEPSLRKIKGYRFLPMLKSNMEKFDQDQSKAA